MKKVLFLSSLVSLSLLVPVRQASAATTLWIGNPGVTASTNWSDLANWNSATPNQNDAKFGGTGSAGDLNTVTSFVDANQGPLSLQYTNQSLTPSFQFHNTMIPAGVTLTVGNGALTVGGLTVEGYRTQVKMTGGGTLLVTNSLTIGNNGVSAANQQTLLDLSGLTNFVFNAPAGTVTMGTGNRSGANFLLANGSNYVTAATWNADTASTSSSVSGTLTLGAGTNIINVNTFNVGHGRSSVTVNFPTTGGLRLRGTAGTDSDRVTMTLGNHATATGNGSTAAGTLAFNGVPVDMKLNTLTLGQSTANTTGGSNPGNGTVQFDTGSIDVTNINMAIANNTTFNSANGTITVGANATLTVGGGGISMANLSGAASAANGTVTINGGLATVSGNIRKTSNAGTATISINPGPSTPGRLTMNAITNTIGSLSVPVDNFSISDSTLTVPTFNGTPSVAVLNFTPGGSTNTINIATVPGLGQFQVITYASLLGSYNFNLGPLPGGYQGYLSNNAGGLSVDLVITNTLAKTDTWRGNLSGNWNTVTANWLSSASPATFTTGDTVIFDDSLTGTPNVVITNPVAPGQISVNNPSTTYVWSGSGKITGTASLSKDGAGSLTLSESGGDDFSGGIVVNNGTLVLDNTNSAISGGLLINGGTASISNNGALPGGAITDNASLVFARTNNLTVTTAVTGSGALSQNGSGTVTLTAANAYTGNTIVNNGVLALTGSGTVSNSAQVQVSNATLDVSAISQSLLSVLNLTNSSVTVALNASGAPAITANGMATGGATNRISFTALPAIASYPVTLTVIQSFGTMDGTFNVGLGTLPVATPSYVGSISQSGGQTVLLTLTSGPIGTRPTVSWTGADVPNLNTNWSDRLNWQLPGAPTNGDNVLFGNNGTVFSSALSTPGGGASSLIPDNFNNIADNSFFLSSLTFSNNSGSYHNTGIASSRSINVTNSGGLSIGVYDAGSPAQQQFVTVSGSNARLAVSNSAANVNVWVGSGNVGGSQATLDLSALDTFSSTVSRFCVGASIGNVVNRPSGIIYLAKTNTISAGFQTTTIENGTTTANAAIVVADCNGNAGGRSFIYLGQANTLSADTIAIGRQKAGGDLRFNSLYANVAPYPSVTIQGFSTSRVSVFNVGDGVGNTGTTTFTANTDLSGGTVNALVDTLNVGRSSSGGTAANATTGNLTFDAGTIDANTVNLGLQGATGTKNGVGTANVASNAVMGAGATLVVRNNLNLGNVIGGGGAAATSGTLNLTNGTVLANNIVPGTGSLSAINLIGGRLVVTNPVGNVSAPLTTLTLAPLGTADNSASLLRIPAPGITVSTLNMDGLTTTTNVINVGSVANLLSFPVELPLIQYSGMNVFGGTFNIGLGTLPAGYSGYLTNDTASSMVGLVILTAPPKPAYITSFSLQSGNLVASGTNGYAGSTYYIVASTNVTLPRTAWTRIATNTFDVNGNFNEVIPVDPTKPARFFSIQSP